jgi:hypothetical protein
MPAQDCCTPECKRALHRRLLGKPPEPSVPYSMPRTVMRNQLSARRQRAREEMLADRKSAPRRTTSVSAGFLTLADLVDETAAPERRREAARRKKARTELQKRIRDLTA